MKTISVIVPVYNNESKLRRCIDSLINQTIKDIEIILINDGSKDNSLEIMKEYEKKYTNIIVIDQTNHGISYSRNKGLEKANSKYIGFVDSDDYVELDMYEKMINKLVSTQSDIVVCDYKIFHEQDSEIRYIDTIKNIVSLEQNPKIIYKLDYAPWNKIYKKELWKDLKFKENIKYEDLDTIPKVFKNAKKIEKVNEYLYNYLENYKGETQTINEKVFDIFIVLEDLIDYFKNTKVEKELKELCISKLFIYNQLISKKNKELQEEFFNQTYEFINKNYPNWEIEYILKSKGIKNFILRIIQTNKKLYRKYLR